METAVNNGMCRCCASEGTFKDVKTKYHWMGEEEVYSEMLKNCLDINLCTSENGDNGGICEVCITQLRNAANFRKQVLHTEEQFKMRLQDKLFKPSIVKVEMLKDDGMESDNNLSEDYSVPEFEVPVKEESPEEAKPKKRTTKASTTRGKKAKLDDGETSTKRLASETAKIDIILEPSVSSVKRVKTSSNVKRNDWTVTITKKHSKKTQVKGIMMIQPMKEEKREIEKHLQNIRMVLLHSNATPIRCHSGFGYSCCFCAERHPEPADLKKHTLEAHDDVTKMKFMRGYPLTAFVVKLDITALKCKLCYKDIETLEQLMEHLKGHGKELHTDINNHILPFRFDSDNFRCVACSKTFEHFKHVQEHMTVHYRNYICDVCNAAFVNKRTLQSHTSRHKQGEFTCSFCPKVFDTKNKKANHEKFVHVGDHKRNKCPHCWEKFVNYAKKLEHMVKEHGVRPLVLKCMACEKTFSNREGLTRHTKRDHLMERRHECNQCDMKFYGRKELLNHMIKHTGVRQYGCDVCLKAFARRHTLREHLRIHEDDRRFKCEHCGQAFIQKCSWKSHMRSKHSEVL